MFGGMTYAVLNTKMRRGDAKCYHVRHDFRSLHRNAYTCDTLRHPKKMVANEFPLQVYLAVILLCLTQVYI